MSKLMAYVDFCELTPLTLHRLLEAITSENPVELVQAAGRGHIPVDPKALVENDGNLPNPSRVVPNSEERGSIADILDGIMRADWYKDQIVHRETFEEKTGQIGLVYSLYSLA